MKKIFLEVMSFVVFLLVVICWGNINPVYAAGKPVAEIVSVESPKNVEDYTIIPALVKNNSREELKGVHLVLHGYDKQKEKMFESSLVSRNDTSYRRGYRKSRGKWKTAKQSKGEWSDGTIKKGVVSRENCRLPDSQYLYGKEFKEMYGKPKYFVVELYVGGELIDVMAKPKRFFEHFKKSEREERLKEWEGIK